MVYCISSSNSFTPSKTTIRNHFKTISKSLPSSYKGIPLLTPYSIKLSTNNYLKIQKAPSWSTFASTSSMLGSSSLSPSLISSPSTPKSNLHNTSYLIRLSSCFTATTRHQIRATTISGCRISMKWL